MHKVALIFVFLALLLHTSLAICPGGWVGVGYVYVDGSAAPGGIFVNDCGVLSYSSENGWCGGEDTWSGDCRLKCVNGKPDWIYTPGGEFHECRQETEYCPTGEIQWCCQRETK